MRAVAGDPAAEFQKHRRGMLVCRYRIAERERAEILQCVIEFIKAGIARGPHRVAFGEQVGGKCAEPEEIIAAVHHHVDGEIVAGVDLEVRADPVADLQALASRVAVLREGKLVAEGTPAALCDAAGTKRLEDAVVALLEQEAPA